MKLKLIVLIVFVLLMSGCLDSISSKVPVLYANITVSEDANGNPTVTQIDARAGEFPKIRAIEDQVPDDFPAIIVNVIQNMMRLNYYTGKDYHGPGVYNFVIGMEHEVNTSVPIIINAYVSFNNSEAPISAMLFNWSTEEQSLNKTFI
ncbi:MAG: hypothetical protein PHH85_05220 [Candidatus Methanoperedens sp.]|nr:hypothetical protein [Candidatus Methanoperedens sp.]